MTNCQNCGDDGECNEPCPNCGVPIDPCGEPTCTTCIEQFTVLEQDTSEEGDEEIVECPVCEGPCQGTCELAQIEREINENAIADRARGK